MIFLTFCFLMVIQEKERAENILQKFLKSNAPQIFQIFKFNGTDYNIK